MNELWQHQHRAIEFARTCHKGVLLNHELGTGKTRTAIEIIALTFLKHPNAKVFIVCPLSVMGHWVKQVEQYHPELSKLLLKLPTSGAKRVAVMKNSKAQIFLANHHALLNKPFMATLPLFDLMVVDECHRFKNPAAKWTKSITEICGRTNYVVLLSGTFILNSPMDAYSQIALIDSKLWGEKNYWVWRLKYFNDKNASYRSKNSRVPPKWEIKEGSMLHISGVINSVTHVVKKNEVLDLPPLLKETRLVALPPSLRKSYYEMDKQLRTIVNDKTFNAASALSKIVKLMQLVNGDFVQGEEHEHVASPKLEVLAELVEQIISANSKCVIWSCFLRPIHDICSMLDAMNIKHVKIIGEMKQPEREAAIVEFQNGDTPIIVCSQGAAGAGIELTAANYMIYYCRNFNLEHDLQSEGRAYRAGSERHEHIVRYDIICEGTIEEQVYWALQHKATLQDLCLNINKIKE